MAETYAFSGTIDVDNGTFEGTITGQEAPPVEPPPIEPPPVEPPPVEPPPVEPTSRTTRPGNRPGGSGERYKLYRTVLDCCCRCY